MSIRRKKDENVFCDFFVFLKTGPVHTPGPPPVDGGRLIQESLSPLQLSPVFGNGTLLDRPDPIARPIPGNVIRNSAIGKFQFANMGPNISLMGPDIQVMPISREFNCRPIAAGATPAIRHTRGRPPQRWSLASPMGVWRLRRSSRLPAPAYLSASGRYLRCRSHVARLPRRRRHHLRLR
jgi:hypothetical protein